MSSSLCPLILSILRIGNLYTRFELRTGASDGLRVRHNFREYGLRRLFLVVDTWFARLSRLRVTSQYCSHYSGLAGMFRKFNPGCRAKGEGSTNAKVCYRT